MQYNVYIYDVKNILAAIYLCASSLICNAQLQESKSTFNLGPQFKSNGVGLLCNVDFKRGFATSHGLSFGISTMKHNKEAKVKSLNVLNPQPYVYGKANRAIDINLSYRLTKTLGYAMNGKPSIKLGCSIGPSIALLRPVYVYIVDYDLNENYRQSLRKYDQNVHDNQSTIQGDAGWNHGFSEIKIEPGIHLSCYAELGHSRDFHARRIVIGSSIDIYPKDLGLIYGIQSRMMSSVFLAYQFGTNPL